MADIFNYKISVTDTDMFKGLLDLVSHLYNNASKEDKEIVEDKLLELMSGWDTDMILKKQDGDINAN